MGRNQRLCFSNAIFQHAHHHAVALSLGLHDVKDISFAEVHRSNMSKLGEDGKPILRESDGKVLKGPNYFKPDLSQFIKKDDKAA